MIGHVTGCGQELAVGPREVHGECCQSERLQREAQQRQEAVQSARENDVITRSPL